jgi:hypothetical protein
MLPHPRAVAEPANSAEHEVRLMYTVEPEWSRKDAVCVANDLRQSDWRACFWSVPGASRIGA